MWFVLTAASGRPEKHTEKIKSAGIEVLGAEQGYQQDYIFIPTMGALIHLIEGVLEEEIVITPGEFYVSEYPVLQIYDDYRE